MKRPPSSYIFCHWLDKGMALQPPRRKSWYVIVRPLNDGEMIENWPEPVANKRRNKFWARRVTKRFTTKPRLVCFDQIMKSPPWKLSTWRNAE